MSTRAGDVAATAAAAADQVLTDAQRQAQAQVQRFPTPPLSASSLTSIPRPQVIEWTLTAKRALQMAEQLCQRANSQIQMIYKTLGAVQDADHSVVIAADDAAASPTGRSDGGVEWKIALFDKNRRTIEKSLQSLQWALQDAGSRFTATAQAFEHEISRLDAHDVALNESLAALKVLRVARELSTRDKDTARTLYSFVDDNGVEALKTEMRYVMDTAESLHESTHSSLQDLRQQAKAHIVEIQKIPKPPELAMPAMQEAERSVLAPGCDATEAYVILAEQQAASMAALLTELTNHYGQCVHAVKDIDSLEPEAQQELQEVLANDTTQLEPIVAELQMRLEDIETMSTTVSTYRREYAAVASALHEQARAVHAFSTHVLPHGLACVGEYEVEMERLTERTHDLRDHLLALTDHYRYFARAYHALQAEVERRARAQAHLESTVQRMRASLEKLAQDETRMRDDFSAQHGDYLPSDLWSGVADSVAQFELVQTVPYNEIPTLTPAPAPAPSPASTLTNTVSTSVSKRSSPPRNA